MEEGGRGRQAGFNSKRIGSGTREWSESSCNVGIGCSHGCLYCYARYNAVARFKTVTPADWSLERLKPGPLPRFKRDGVIMFPTTHDITPFYLEASLKALTAMISAGNQVLVVSKPHLPVIVELCKAFRNQRTQVLFRFTIGSLDFRTCAFWEPGAPPPSERVLALQHAFHEGFQTSVSMEPMLEGVSGAVDTFEMVQRYCTDKVWIGKMNRPRQRVLETGPEVLRQVTEIERKQRKAAICRLYDQLQGHPKVEWKSSIKETLNGEENVPKKDGRPNVERIEHRLRVESARCKG